MRKGGAALLAGALALAGCGDAGPAAPAARRPLYFDVKGLLSKQVELLEQRHAATVKSVSLRDGAIETVRVPDVKWADELQIFFQADINKAALRGAYTVDSVAMEAGVSRRVYTLLPGHPNAPVTRLVVIQRRTEPLELAATVVQNNPLFSAQKQLRLIFKDGKLWHYNVTGSQKLIFFDKLSYSAGGQAE
jgi:hypothetical protein